MKLTRLDMSMDVTDQIDLPVDYSRKVASSTDKYAVRFQLAKSLFGPLRNVKGKSAYFEGLLCGYALWLNKQTRTDEIRLAVFTSLQECLGDMNVESFCANLNMAINEPFVEVCIEAMKSIQKYELDEKVCNSNVQFEYYQENTGLQGLPNNPACDCTLRVFETRENLHLELQLSKDLFAEETVTLMAEGLQCLLNTVLTNAYLKMNLIDWVPESHLKAVERFNRTDADCPLNETIIDRYEKTLCDYPNQTALICGDETLTYHEFDHQVNQVASYLQNSGVGKKDVVAVHSKRSFDMMVALFGILKAGAIYLPIDVNQPVNRIDYILKDAGAKLVLTDQVMESPCEVNTITVAQILLVSEQTTFKSLAQADEVAYIIYTSGSTGQPKGVMIQHNSLLNRINWFQNTYPHDSKDVFIQKTSISFDVSVWELVWWSQIGASLCLAEHGAEKEPEKLCKAISQHKITTIHFVPSMLRVFYDSMERKSIRQELESLRWVFASGEALESADVQAFYRLFGSLPTDLINLYGPTEATIDVTHFNCRDFNIDRKVPIGKPIDNTQIHILDKDLNPLPIGIPGELCIAGIQVACGYIGKEQLSREKFVEQEGIEGSLYRSGDLARWLPDGNIEYLGRLDDQVKIRGYRIELGEISNQLKNHDSISDATVLVHCQGNNPQLIAYYLGTETLECVDLVRFLQVSLPDYMIPSHFIKMNSFPLTPNGKLDKRSFPNPEVSSVDTFVPADSDLEMQLLNIWGKALSLDPALIGVNHHFFELGGNSLTCTLLNNLLSQEFGTTFSLEEIFERPTVREQAKLINLRDWVNQDDHIGEAEELII